MMVPIKTFTHLSFYYNKLKVSGANMRTDMNLKFEDATDINLQWEDATLSINKEIDGSKERDHLKKNVIQNSIFQGWNIILWTGI